MLAKILRTDPHVHRPLPADTELARSIAVLARACQDATWRRTRAGNELRSLLREYYPAMLEAAADRSGNLATALTRALLELAPTPAAALTLSKTHIAAALRRAGRSRNIYEVAANSTGLSAGRICLRTRSSSKRWASRHCSYWQHSPAR